MDVRQRAARRRRHAHGASTVFRRSPRAPTPRSARRAAAAARSPRRAALGGPVAPPAATTSAVTARRSPHRDPRVDAAAARPPRSVVDCGRASSSRTPASGGTGSARRLGVETSSLGHAVADLAAIDRAAVGDRRCSACSGSGSALIRVQATYGMQYFPTVRRHAQRVRSARARSPASTPASTTRPRRARRCGFGYGIPTAAGDYSPARARASAWPWSMSSPDVVVYGATGLAGRLASCELDAAGVAFAIAGRDTGELAVLAAELPAATTASRAPTSPTRSPPRSRARAWCSIAPAPLSVDRRAGAGRGARRGRALRRSRRRSSVPATMSTSATSRRRDVRAACAVPGAAVDCALGDWAAAWAAALRVRRAGRRRRRCRTEPGDRLRRGPPARRGRGELRVRRPRALARRASATCSTRSRRARARVAAAIAGSGSRRAPSGAGSTPAASSAASARS